MRVPCSQENLSGKDLDEQSGDSWVPVMAQSGHEGDKQSRENWVIERAHSGHEGEEQSVAGQAVYRTYSFHERVGCRMPEWCQVLRRGAGQPEEC